MMMKPDGFKVIQTKVKGHSLRYRYSGGLCILWCLAVLCTGLMLLARSMDNGGNFMSLTGANRVADMFRGIVLPGADSSLHVSGTQLFGSAVVQFRKKIDCFSDHYDMQCEERFLNQIPGAVDGDRANQIAANGSATEWIVREELKWEWKPDESLCPLHPSHREDFCRLIGPKNNMMVVGDSLNQQLFWILLNHLVVNRTGWPEPPTQLWEWSSPGVREVCADVLGGPGQGFTISFVRNDRLSLILHRAEDHFKNFHELPWINLVEEWNVSVLLLNRGAHFEDDANITEALTNMYSVIRTHWPAARVFYRNTPPGHINCTQHHEPLKERDTEGRLKQFSSRNYHWADFARQNEIARQITHRFGHSFIDLDSVMALRADGHPMDTDCLHYCMPGPLDVFAKLFYNTLRLLS